MRNEFLRRFLLLIMKNCRLEIQIYKIRYRYLHGAYIDRNHFAPGKNHVCICVREFKKQMQEKLYFLRRVIKMKIK